MILTASNIAIPRVGAFLQTIFIDVRKRHRITVDISIGGRRFDLQKFSQHLLQISDVA